MLGFPSEFSSNYLIWWFRPTYVLVRVTQYPQIVHDDSFISSCYMRFAMFFGRRVWIYFGSIQFIVESFQVTNTGMTTTRKHAFSNRFRNQIFSVSLETELETDFFIVKVKKNRSLYRLLLNYRDRIRDW
jgi:hypothetical protein